MKRTLSVGFIKPDGRPGLDGTPYRVQIDDDAVLQMVRKAMSAKTGKATDGPLTVVIDRAVRA